MGEPIKPCITITRLPLGLACWARESDRLTMLFRNMRAPLFVWLMLACSFVSGVSSTTSLSLASRAPKHAIATPTPNPPIVIAFTIIAASRGAAILRSIYPNARITVDNHANAVIVVASGYDEEGMHTIAAGIDVKNPTDTVVDTYQLKVISPSTAASHVGSVFPSARIVVAPNRNIVIMASPSDMAQIKSIVAAIDTAPPTPSPKPRYPAEAVRVTQRNVKDIARAVAATSSGVRVSVSGSEILLAGPQEDVDHAKQLIAELDVPQMGTQYTQVYRIKYVEANSVADLFRRSFTNLPIVVNTDLNALTVTANMTVQRRLADAIDQLDVAPPGAAGGGQGGGGGGSGVEVIELRAAVPGINGGPSTSAADIAQTVTQALQANAPDLHIIVPPNATQLVLTGSPYSIKQAKDLIAKLDIPPQLVALDTEVLELDETTEKQLGLKLTPPALSSTFTEVAPVYPTGNANAGAQIPYLSWFPLIRSPMSLTAQLDFLVATNKAKILEDPRITTVSGRTASLRAGETVNILTTTGGGTGTVATTQVQSFQTGVTLDITPVVNTDNYITVTLHPSVNSEAGVSAAGVPNIQTRDTTTTVGLHDGETIVIGGLIEDEDSVSIQKIPILGDIPLIGRLFQDKGINHTRNELIITVTPHIVRPGEAGNYVPSDLGVPKPGPLPTLPPDMMLPAPRNLENVPTPRQERPTPAPEPSPVNVPAPQSEMSPKVAAFTPPPGYATPSAQHAGAPMPATQATAANPPNPLPSAFAQTNVYTYGSSPQNNFANASQPPQIFYVQVSPSVVRNGQQMTVSAITSTNVAKLEFGPNKLVPMTSLQTVNAGQWQSTFSFSAAGLPIGQPNVTLLLTATTSMGGTVTLPIPISLVNP
jgi:type II secretory pathway component GspD/PulD (secretin)